MNTEELKKWLREMSHEAQIKIDEHAGFAISQGDYSELRWHQGAKHMADAVLTWIADHEFTVEDEIAFMQGLAETIDLHDDTPHHLLGSNKRAIPPDDSDNE